jgi:hypothetical protein
LIDSIARLDINTVRDPIRYEVQAAVKNDGRADSTAIAARPHDVCLRNVVLAAGANGDRTAASSLRFHGIDDSILCDDTRAH